MAPKKAAAVAKKKTPSTAKTITFSGVSNFAEKIPLTTGMTAQDLVDAKGLDMDKYTMSIIRKGAALPAVTEDTKLLAGDTVGITPRAGIKANS